MRVNASPPPWKTLDRLLPRLAPSRWTGAISLRERGQSSARAWYARARSLFRADGCRRSAPRLPHLWHRAFCRSRSLEVSAPHRMIKRGYRQGHPVKTVRIPAVNPQPGGRLAHVLQRRRRDVERPQHRSGLVRIEGEGKPRDLAVSIRPTSWGSLTRVWTSTQQARDKQPMCLPCHNGLAA